MDNPFNILFVDDQWCKLDSQSVILAEYGSLLEGELAYKFHYETAEDGSGSYSATPVINLIKKIPDLKAVILDIMFGGQGDRLGLEILSSIREQYPTLPVFMMTSLDDDIDVIERVMELGANEYLIKKPTLKELETALRIYTRPSTLEADDAIWGNSQKIRQVRALIARVSVGGTAKVLITGESGTGKELVARAIHRQGPRRKGDFIDKNCAEDNSSLLDSDLFGHEKGAFTGAERRYIGRIERANDGVLFLDEIGGMPRKLQGKLLRVLETHEFQRLGGSKNIKSDFQLICATNEDPERMVASGKLRGDLYHRINQFPIHVPPLRERLEDIPILADYFLKRFKATVGASYIGDEFASDALESLKLLQWPGNVRELKNIVERSVILSREPTIKSEELNPNYAANTSRINSLSTITNNNILPEDKDQWARHFVLMKLRVLAEAIERTKSSKDAVEKLFSSINKPGATHIKRYLDRQEYSSWGFKTSEDEEINSLIQQLRKSKGYKQYPRQKKG